MKRLFVCSLTFLCCMKLLTMAAESSSGYHLIKKVSLGSAPGQGEYFDYLTVDSEARRIYVAHGTEVQVLDADNFSIIGTISGLKRCHGIALVPDLDKGFITDGEAGKVVVFRMKDLTVTRAISTFPDADGIVYDPASKLVFSFNGDSKNVSVISPLGEAVVKTIDLKGGPEQPVADGKGLIYDNNEETNEVVVIDTKALAIKERWSVQPAGHPVAIAMDREHRRLFSASRGPQMLLMIDADKGKIIQSFPITGGVDSTIYDPETGMVFSSTRQGMMHVFKEDAAHKLSRVETITTEFGAKTMAMDPKTHDLVLVTADFSASTPKAERRPVKGSGHLLIYGR